MWNLDINCLLVSIEWNVCLFWVDCAIVIVAVVLLLLHFVVSICRRRFDGCANGVVSWKKSWIISKRGEQQSNYCRLIRAQFIRARLWAASPFLRQAFSIWKVHFNNDVVNSSLDSIKQSSIACRRCGNYFGMFIVWFVHWIWIHVIRHIVHAESCHFSIYFHQVFWKANCRK